MLRVGKILATDEEFETQFSVDLSYILATFATYIH
jgi:hypothetical protein